MLIGKVVCFIIPFVMGVISAAIAFRAISNGFVTPVRMGRWSKPAELDRDKSPFEFWFWVAVYVALCAGMFVFSVKGLHGEIALR